MLVRWEAELAVAAFELLIQGSLLYSPRPCLVRRLLTTRRRKRIHQTVTSSLKEQGEVEDGLW